MVTLGGKRPYVGADREPPHQTRAASRHRWGCSGLISLSRCVRRTASGATDLNQLSNMLVRRKWACRPGRTASNVDGNIVPERLMEAYYHDD